MSKLQFKLNKAGVRKFLRSEEMAQVCGDFARDIRDKCGEGYEVSVYTGGKTRVNASVKAVTQKAKKDNFDNNTLEKALR